MNADTVFTKEWTAEAFSPERTDAFFDALFGDAEEGAYTIALRFVQGGSGTLEFAFDLHQRAGKCLVCNLTYGLPQVFARHPIINVKALVEKICLAVGADPAKATWKLGVTKEISNALHSVPLLITLE